MENASKALLIAAAVLVVILLIAFGMRILNSSTDTSKQAIDTGNQIAAGATNAAQSANAALENALKFGE